jgi:hypothetical protein
VCQKKKKFKKLKGLGRRGLDQTRRNTQVAKKVGGGGREVGKIKIKKKIVVIWRKGMLGWEKKLTHMATD